MAQLPFYLLLLFTVLYQLPVRADSSATLFTLIRTNYKPEKVLHYDLVFDAKKCVINDGQPFDVYYVDAQTGERLTEFSSNSAQYFSPRLNEAHVTKTSAELNFKALDEVRKLTGIDAKIVGVITRTPSGCEVTAELHDGNSVSQLEEIVLKMKIKFGLPVGVQWVKVKVLNNGQAFERCLTDQCD